MVRILHLADLHLDSPFRGLAELRPELASRLRDASLIALDRAVEAAVALREDGGLDAVTIGGDVFDIAAPSLRAVTSFNDALRRLDEAGIRCFIVAGNHDPLDGRDTWRRLAVPPRHKLFAGSWEVEPLDQDGRRVAAIVGRSYSTRDADVEALAGFPTVEAPLRVGLLHSDVDGPSGETSYQPVRLQALRATRFDAWLLGHIHGGRSLSEDPLVVYAGTIQGRDVGSGELGPKGAVLVELEPGRPSRATPLPLAPVRWVDLSVDVSGCAAEPEVVDLLRGELVTALAQHNPASPVEVAAPDGLIARVSLVGNASSSDLWRRLTLTEPLREMAEEVAAVGDDPFVMVEQITSQVSGPLPSGAELRERSDLLGDFARLLDEAADPESEAAVELRSALGGFGQRGPALEFRDDTELQLDPVAYLARIERLVVANLAECLAEGGDDEA